VSFTIQKEKAGRKKIFKHFQKVLESNRNNIPLLPQVLVQVHHALSDRQAGAKKLAEIIHNDLALSASILRLANSAYYRRQSSITIRTVTSAIVLIGINKIRNFTLGLSVYNMLNNLPKSESYRYIWQHSLCCAVCARDFARRLGGVSEDEAFLAGMLHDIGKILLGHFYTEQYSRVCKLMKDEELEYHVAEDCILSLNHLDIGAFLADYWKFPEPIAKVLSEHHFDREKGDSEHPDYNFQLIIAVANLVAKFLFNDPNYNVIVSRKKIEFVCIKFLGITPLQLDEILLYLKEEVQEAAQIYDIILEEWCFSKVSKLISKTDQDIIEPDTRSSELLDFLIKMNSKAEKKPALSLFFHQTISQLRELLNLQMVLLLVYDPVEKCLKSRFGHGFNASRIFSNVIIKLDSANEISACTFLRKKTTRATSQNLHLFSRMDSTNLIQLFGSYNLVAFPLNTDDQCKGVMVVSREFDAEVIGEQDLGILSLYIQNLIRLWPGEV
jgi:putative nucleotidyltransferase with HDIG domain